MARKEVYPCEISAIFIGHSVSSYINKWPRCDHMNRHIVQDAIWKLRPRKMVTLRSAKRNAPRAMQCYLPRPVGWKEDDPRLHGHSNQWESREIAFQLCSMGYSVDAISFDDLELIPRAEYDVIFDIHRNLQRLAPLYPDSCKLLHITGSYPRFQNDAEARRAIEFEGRTGKHYEPKRQIPDLDVFDRSLKAADECSLIGNESTLRTFPEEYRKKMSLVTVSASKGYVKSPERLVPPQGEFVWFFGGGAVHKGLDLVLEAFTRLPGFRLNVIGNVAWEKDFMAAYSDLLLKSENIRYHGILDPDGPRFREIMDRSYAFIAPSCSEAISTAAATAMQAGLYPIVSRETGITLPEGHGTYLEHCHIDEIVQACQNIISMSAARLRQDAQACQALALRQYSRHAFTEDMRSYLASAIDHYDGVGRPTAVDSPHRPIVSNAAKRLPH